MMVAMARNGVQSQAQALAFSQQMAAQYGQLLTAYSQLQQAYYDLARRTQSRSRTAAKR